MKKLLALALVALSVSFASAQQVGGDKDKNGCNAAAGYTWSALKKECVRLFQAPVKLKEAKPNGTASFFAAVFFNDDQTKAEIFLPTGKPVIATRSGKAGAYSWKGGGLLLKESKADTYVLSKNGKVVYKGLSN